MDTDTRPGTFTIPRKPANAGSAAVPRGLTAGESALLAELQNIHAALLPPPVAEQELTAFKINTLLQVSGFLAATVFGVFSILAWLAATKSNQISANALSQALQSNQIALLAYCLSGNSTTTPAICENILSQAPGAVAPIVASVLPNVPTTAIASTTSSTTSSSSSTSTSSTDTTASTSSSTTSGGHSIQGSTASSEPPVTATTTSEPTSAAATGGTTSTPTPGGSPNTSAATSGIGSNVGAIVGGVLGLIAALAAVMLIVWRRRSYKSMVSRKNVQEQEKAAEHDL